jgi:large conductance mechanosensitive channel
MKIVQGFKDFIMRGNVIELAVGVIIGAAFSQIVNSLVKDILTPLIGKIFGEPDFSKVKPGDIPVGNFINAVVVFLLTAIAVYFFIILPYQKLNELRHRGEEKEETPPPEDILLLREIRDSLQSRSWPTR